MTSGRRGARMTATPTAEDRSLLAAVSRWARAEGWLSGHSGGTR